MTFGLKCRSWLRSREQCARMRYGLLRASFQRRFARRGIWKYMTKLLQKINLKKWGILSFLVFFIFTPILVKVKIWDEIYVEPLMPLLVLSFVLIISSFFKKIGRVALSPELKN